MVRPVKRSQESLKKSQTLVVSARQIITGALSARSRNWFSPLPPLFIMVIPLHEPLHMGGRSSLPTVNGTSCVRGQQGCLCRCRFSPYKIYGHTASGQFRKTY